MIKWKAYRETSGAIRMNDFSAIMASLWDQDHVQQSIKTRPQGVRSMQVMPPDQTSKWKLLACRYL